MKCMLCGTENRDEANRCKGCGSSLKGTSANGTSKRTPAPTVLEGNSEKVPIVPTPPPPRQQAAYEAPPLQQPQVGPGGPAGGKRKTQFVPPEELSLGNQQSVEQTPQQPPHDQTRAQQSTGAARTTADAKRKTVYVPPEGLPSLDGQPSVSGTHGAVQGRPSQPRLTGFLVSFTWDTTGQWFPIREGKNIFGTDADCDGAIPGDTAMSGHHFVVHCRGKRVVIKDLGSTNATFVDDEELSYDHTDAGNAAVIRAGDSLFQLMLVPPLSVSE